MWIAGLVADGTGRRYGDVATGCNSLVTLQTLLRLYYKQYFWLTSNNQRLKNMKLVYWPRWIQPSNSFSKEQAQLQLWLVASVCSYGGLQGTGNWDYCAAATQGVSKRNPCWPGWRPACGRGQCVYACHRALESSMAQTDASDYFH